MSDVSVYYRARRMANFALFTIDLQLNRLTRDELEDRNFILRRWADFHFFILALVKIRRAGLLARKLPSIKSKIDNALKEFDLKLPYLITMRNVDQHFEDYAVDEGWNKNISRQSLEVGMYDNQVYNWLGFEVDIQKAFKASKEFFQVIKESEHQAISSKV
ncbi:hypothetical protein KA119_00665 [Candidatus Gracilibacteria bacterium]|nr:hypothetical protein [Candidatus Gracilibacteria bacterium]